MEVENESMKVNVREYGIGDGKWSQSRICCGVKEILTEIIFDDLKCKMNKRL